jgi:hypothetical protein
LSVPEPFKAFLIAAMAAALRDPSYWQLIKTIRIMVKEIAWQSCVAH